MSQSNKEQWVRRAGLSVGSAVVAALFLMAPSAEAQQAAGISGQVRDSSGLALPGATVEASSPALIEKTRAVTTDGRALFHRRPSSWCLHRHLQPRGILQGGQGWDRPGIGVHGAGERVAGRRRPDRNDYRDRGLACCRHPEHAPAGNAEFGQLESLPSGNIGLQTLAYVTPGFAATQADVGGTRDTWSAQGNYTLYHGKTGTRANFDGFRNQYFIGAASGVGYITDSGNIAELQLETSGMGADKSGSGSTSLNAIPKSGSNTFAGGLDGYFSNGAMQSANIRSNLNDWAQGNPTLLATAGISSAAECSAHLSAGRPARRADQAGQDLVLQPRSRGGASTVQQPSAFFNPLQGKANIPGRGWSVRQRRCSIRGSRGRPTRPAPTATSASRSRLPASTGTGTTPAASPRR